MALAGLRFPQVQTPDDFDWPRVYDYDALIGDNPATLAWMVPTEDRVTLSAGAVTNVVDRANPALTYAGNGPTWLEDAHNGRPGVNFTVASPRKYLDVDGVVPTAADCSGVVVFTTEPNTATTRTLLLTRDSPASLRLNLLSANGIERIEFAVKVGSNEARAFPPQGSIPNDTAATYVVFWAWDFSAKTASISMDGGQSWYSATNALIDGGPANANLRIGAVSTSDQALDGAIEDLWIGNVCLRDTEQASLLSTLRRYVYERYGLLSAP